MNKLLTIFFASILLCSGREFDDAKYDTDDASKYNVAVYIRSLKASYHYNSSKSGDAIIRHKNQAIVWSWKDGKANAVSQYFMDGFGQYVLGGTYNCSFKLEDVVHVAELFVNGEDEEFLKRYKK